MYLYRDFTTCITEIGNDFKRFDSNQSIGEGKKQHKDYQHTVSKQFQLFFPNDQRKLFSKLHKGKKITETKTKVQMTLVTRTSMQKRTRKREDSGTEKPGQRSR